MRSRRTLLVHTPEELDTEDCVEGDGDHLHEDADEHDVCAAGRWEQEIM